MASRYGLEIRAVVGSDATALSELLSESGPPVVAPALVEDVEALRRDVGVALIAVEWGPPSGVIVLHWYRPLASKRTALISLLLVASDARRRGVGRLLLKAGAQAARAAGCDDLQVLTPPDAEELEAFCRATGFNETGRGFARSLRRRS